MPTTAAAFLALPHSYRWSTPVRTRASTTFDLEPPSNLDTAALPTTSSVDLCVVGMGDGLFSSTRSLSEFAQLVKDRVVVSGGSTTVRSVLFDDSLFPPTPPVTYAHQTTEPTNQRMRSRYKQLNGIIDDD